MNVRSKVKIITFRLISYGDGTNKNCEPKLYRKDEEGSRLVWTLYISKYQAGQIRPPNENVARVSCDTFSWEFGT